MAIRPEVRSPQTGHKRLGRGFTPKELREAGLTMADARWMAIPIDRRRSTHYPENVALLKEYANRLRKLGAPAKRKKKVEVAEPEAARRAPAKTDLTELRGVSKKMAETLVAAGFPNIRALAYASPRRLARRAEIKQSKAEKLIDEAKQYLREKAKAARERKAQPTRITELKDLPDITRADVKKLKDLGVETLEDLKRENARDLSLLTGIPETRIKAWIKAIREQARQKREEEKG